MEKIENFNDFKRNIERKTPKAKKSEYKPEGEGHCLAQCDRKIVTDVDGKRKIACDYCKRIVHSL